MRHKFWLLLILVLTFSLTLFSCGGGGSSGGGNTQTGTVKGTVSGTTVIAVNSNDDIVASDYTAVAGKTANANGRYSFTLRNIPAGEDIRIYLIEKDGVYPMYFDDNGSSTNVFSLAASRNINLGFVGRRNGQAVPEHNPTGYPGVLAGAAVSGMPSSISNPSLPIDASLSDLVKNGKTALSNWWFEKAKNYLGAAVNDISPSNQSEDANSARFFYALASLSAFSTHIRSDSMNREPSGMNNPGDVLDKMGCTGSRENFDTINCSKASLAETSLTGADVKNFLYSQVKSKIEDAISKLNNIDSSSFSTTWIEPVVNKQVDVDYGDVLILKAALEGMAAAIDYQYAYNLDANVADEVNAPNNTIEDFLGRNSSFLTYDNSHSTALSDAKTETIAMLGDLYNAIDNISKETDDQSDDLITLPSQMTQQDIDDIKAKIGNLKNCIISGKKECTIQNHGTSDTSDDIILDMSIPFSGIDIRDLLPPFNGNTPGLFPDPSLDDFVVQPSDYINKDVSPKDGIPDILQGFCIGGCE